MERFIEALKLNLLISHITQNLELDNDNETRENLKKLNSIILNVDVPIYYLDIVSKLQYIYITSIIDAETDDFIDYSDINKYENLQSLIITHNKNIRKLDVSNLKKLNTLIIVGNENLTEINGIENLKNLDRVIIVGNNIKVFNDMRQFLINIKNVSMCKLDVNMYHYLINDSSFDIKTYNVDFAEKISVGEFYSLDLGKMEELYNIGLQIIQKIISNDMDEYEKVRKIYKYIVENLSYDYDSLEERNKYVYSNSISVYGNDYKDINTSYKALKDHMVVCEGYANSLKFLLNIIGVESKTIVCFFKNSGESFEYFNHTASMIKIDGIWYYCDSQLENDSGNLKYFLQTREEFEITHRLKNEKNYIK